MTRKNASARCGRYRQEAANPPWSEGNLLKTSPHPTTTLTLALLTLGLLAGCATTPTSTSTPTSTPTPSVSVARQATEEDEPFTLPVNTCYTNGDEEDTPMYIGDQKVLSGKTACFVTDDRDTETKFYWSDQRNEFFATFKASNPYVGKPWLSIKFFGELEPNSHQYAANETMTFVDTHWDWIYTVLRKEDTNKMKQFTVVIDAR